EKSTNDDLKLSEDEEEIANDKSKTTTKKGPTKRSAPASGKKTTISSTKKKGQTDEPFEDRTNDEEIENNTDEDVTPAKQPKKGRSADKAPTSTSKTAANRSGKKTKAT
ncbi:unnamed protein product, partial [Adineta steineri]